MPSIRSGAYDSHHITYLQLATVDSEEIVDGLVRKVFRKALVAELAE